MAFSQEQAAENKHSILKEDEVPGAELLKEPEKCVVEELKRWLECHALNKIWKKGCIDQKSEGWVEIKPSCRPQN